MLFGALLFGILYLSIPVFLLVKFNISRPIEIIIKFVVFYLCMFLGTITGVILSYFADPTQFKHLTGDMFNIGIGQLGERSLFWIFAVPIMCIWDSILLWVELNIKGGGLILYATEIFTVVYLMHPLNRICNFAFCIFFDRPDPYVYSQPANVKATTEVTKKKKLTKKQKRDLEESRFY
jgi:hypothetical protein